MIDLHGKRGLVIGIANEHSIAAGCAEAFAASGARLAATYLNAKAEPSFGPSRIGSGANSCSPATSRSPGSLKRCSIG